MSVRNYMPGDEVAQAEVYNEAAGGWPGFKPATRDEVRKRTLARDFDPASRFYAVEDGRVVGYCTTLPACGRVSYPFCRPGHERQADTLFAAAVASLKARGVRRAFAAYRADWPAPAAFFPARGFPKARDILNFVLPLTDLPTLSFKPSLPLTPLAAGDMPALRAMVPGLLRIDDDAALARYLLQNPYFGPDAVFVLRNRADNSPAAVGVLVCDPTYADAQKLDAAMPCFRLGAFGTEGVPPKRVNGLFSFLVPPGPRAVPLVLDLLGHAANQLDDSTVEALAAQVPSDAGHLVPIYERNFRRQPGFPVYEASLT